jgi:hypothetical protein
MMTALVKGNDKLVDEEVNDAKVMAVTALLY